GIATPIPPRAPVIITQPVSVTRNVGDWVIFSVGASGTRPFVFQWSRNSQVIPSATAQTYRASNVTTNNSGDFYSVSIMNIVDSTNSANATLTVLPDPPADVASGLISFWPFDTVTNVITDATNYYATADLYSRNDMRLVDLTSGNLVSGQFNSALNFDGFTQYAYRVGGFPIYTTTNYSVSMWVSADGSGQTDRRLFSEGSSTNGNSLFSLGTEVNGASPSARVFVRTTGNAVALDRLSTRPVFDNQWHHLVWVDRNGQGKLYIDGVLDETDFTYARGSLAVDTTSVGAILRAASTNWFWGTVDEVAEWNRPLTQTEIQQVLTAGIPVPVAPTPPSIIQQPVGANVYTRSTVTFSVTAAGTSPLYYQWIKDTSPISGATKASLTLTNVQVADSGAYTVIVSNVADRVTSDAAVLVVTQRPAPPASLAIDFNDRSATASDTPSGFESFILTGSGATTAATTYLYGGVEATLLSLDSSLDTRKRGAPTNTAGFTQEKLLQDFVFATSTTGTNGLGVTLKYLEPNQSYNVTVWSFDSVSSGSVNLRVSDWFINGILVKEGYAFDGNILPQADGDDQFTVPATTDAAGTLALEARRNLASGSQIGVFLNALKTEIAQFRVGSVERLANGNLRLTIQTPEPTQEHHVQQTASLSNVSWTEVSGVTLTQNGNTLEAEWTPEPGEARFYRVVRMTP
ncbi:MAG TPA: LamG-like jellyroll fold domain-containing protein, partial [Haliangiales bacterium]|nr:LamG-like jellyroll fold domain-containing protein [Haliangiales bacterium]